MRPFIYEFSELRAEQVFAGLADQPYSLFFDSADRGHKDARYSYIAAFPAEIIETDDIDALKAKLTAFSTGKILTDGLPPFQGGAAGLFEYEGRIRAGLYDQVMAFDHEQDKAWLIIHEETQAKADEKRVRFFVEKNAEAETHSISWQSQDPTVYKNQIKCVIDYIHAGDIFQANLSQRFKTDLPEDFDAYAHYLYLRDVNPAPYAAFMNCGDMQVSSASPESFLKVENGTVETRPIKGTRKRHEDAEQDQISKHILETSAKDKAENVMIVDLMRNDLSKVCTPESVAVTSLCAVESFASVHHLVSTVEGKLEQNQTALDAMAACFPGGSITGAPKIRAMEIIAELEQEPRGPYCGSIFYAGFNGAMKSNILIRTLVYKDRQVVLRSGGGITAQSEPNAEYQETIDKAERLFRSFGMTDAARKRA